MELTNISAPQSGPAHVAFAASSNGFSIALTFDERRLRARQQKERNPLGAGRGESAVAQELDFAFQQFQL